MCTLSNDAVTKGTKLNAWRPGTPTGSQKLYDVVIANFLD